MNINKQKLAPYAFISPFIILFIAFSGFPLIFSIFLAFQKWTGVGGMNFIGLKHFAHIFSAKGGLFWKSLVNTFWLLIMGSLPQHLIAIPLAVLLNSARLKGREFFKTGIFLPYITSSVAVALIFQYFFDYNNGMFNYFIELFGGTGTNWLTDTGTIKPAIAVLINWKWIGWNTVLYFAGLQAIPNELYESAEIEGSTTFQKFFYITLPMLIPVIFMAVTFSIIGGMQIFDEPAIITGGMASMGGTDNAGLSSILYLYTLGFRWGKLGYGSAMVWILFFIILIMTRIYKRIMTALEQ